MEPIEFIKTGEDGTSFVLNEAAIELLQNVKKPLVGQYMLITEQLGLIIFSRLLFVLLKLGQVE